MKAFKYRFYPTNAQANQLARTFGCCRFAYNWALAVRKNAFDNLNTSLNTNSLIKMLTKLKRADGQEFLNEVSSVPLQQAVRNLGAAYDRFFKSHTGFPNFKKKFGNQSASFTKNAFKLNESGLTLAKNKTPLRIKWSQPLDGEPLSLTISKDKIGRYFVSILCNVEIAPKPVINNTVGLDLGLTHFCILSDGSKIPNPHFYKKLESKLKKLQRSLSKKVKFSANWQKTKLKVARLHTKIADCRRDFLHKLSTRLVNESQVICTETLRIKNMLKSHTLAKAISDVSWSEFLRQLEYKSKWYGRDFVRISQWFPSSKMCSVCGAVQKKMPLNIRHWTCECGSINDRDINAAINIKRVGLTQLACGDSIRPTSSIRMTWLPSMKQESQML